MAHKDPVNPYTATMANDYGEELVQIVIDWYRGHRNVFTSTQVTNISNAITNVLNGTNRV